MDDLKKLIADYNVEEEMTAWRHHLHAIPELGFKENLTSSYVASQLTAIGVDDVTENVGGTGIVATIQGRSGGRAIALRADMDALPIQEKGSATYRSKNDGVMHACGHDGHTAMLLGAARILKEKRDFAGVVRLIFQPSEERGNGALALLDDGLLERFPFEEIYGIHNLPGLRVGALETRSGTAMSAEDNFVIRLSGQGGHSSMPDQLRETLVAACSLVLDLQTIISRRTNPAEFAVLSVTDIRTDGAHNILPGLVTLSGDVRSVTSRMSDRVEAELRRVVEGVAQTYACTSEVEYSRPFIPLNNDPELTRYAVEAATAVFGKQNVEAERDLIPASEDFAQYLRNRPGNFSFIGNGESSSPLHTSTFDFNDDALVSGALYHYSIVQERLGVLKAHPNKEQAHDRSAQ